jgi:hypothetical protein
MAYDETPRKPIEIREGRCPYYASHDELIDRAESSGKYGVRTDAAAEGVGYLGVDDLDRIRRENLRHKTK